MACLGDLYIRNRRFYVIRRSRHSPSIDRRLKKSSSVTDRGVRTKRKCDPGNENSPLSGLCSRWPVRFPVHTGSPSASRRMRRSRSGLAPATLASSTNLSSRMSGRSQGREATLATVRLDAAVRPRHQPTEASNLKPHDRGHRKG